MTGRISRRGRTAIPQVATTGSATACGSVLFLYAMFAIIPLEAQTPRRFEAALGVARPTGGLASFRRSGPAARIGVEFGKSTGIARMRVDIEAVMLAARSVPATRMDGTGDYRTAGASASYIVGPTWGPISPYVLAGIGMHVSSMSGRRNPYGAVYGTHAGGGVRLARGRYKVALEITRHLLLTDYGTTEEFSFGGYVPITLSMQF